MNADWVPGGHQPSHKANHHHHFITTRRSYASVVLGVVILSVRLSVRHTRALWLIQRTYRRYFYTTWKGNPSSQMWFFVQLCSSWHDFNWLKSSRGPSAIAELLVIITQPVSWYSFPVRHVPTRPSKPANAQTESTDITNLVIVSRHRRISYGSAKPGVATRQSQPSVFVSVLAGKTVVQHVYMTTGTWQSTNGKIRLKHANIHRANKKATDNQHAHNTLHVYRHVRHAPINWVSSGARQPM